MNESYVLKLRERYYVDEVFRETVNEIADSLITSQDSKSDIVKICDMAAMIAVDAKERGF